MPLTDQDIAALQNTLVHRKGKCKECKGSGKAPWRPAGQCPTCSSSGEGDYLLGDMVRVRCKNWIPAPSGGWNHKPEQTEPFHPGDCPDCHEGTVASTDIMDWADAAAAIGTPFNMRKEGDTWCAFYEDMYDKRGEGPSLMEAVLLALEKAEEK